MQAEQTIHVMHDVTAYDEALAAHCFRVFEYVSKMTQTLSVTSEELKMAALVHDVGKIFINKEILNKNGALTDTERSIVDLHSYFGYCYLRSLSVKPMVCNLVLFHHGTDKPRMDLIPNPDAELLYLADILRVCDIYDALTVDRSYHRKMERTEALSVLRRESVPSVFVDCMEQITKDPGMFS